MVPESSDRLIDAARRGSSLPWPEFINESDGARLIYQLRQHTNQKSCAIQFIAAHTGEGTSSVVRDISLIGAELQQRVLLLDLSQSGRGQASWLRARFHGPGSLAALRRSGAAIGPALPQGLRILRVGDTSLCVSETTAELLPLSAQYSGLLSGLHTLFDLILIDSPPLGQSADALLLAQYVAASVLVVAAESTHIKVVEDLRDRILQVDGVIAGILLNKRRFHIPRIIYQRL